MRRGAVLIALIVVAAACGGDDQQPTAAADPSGQGGAMNLSSEAFEHEGTIPAAYTCDGEDLSPPLAITGVPDGAVTLALVMDDPDAPRGVWDHWVVYDVPAPGESLTIPAGVASLGTAGRNSWGRSGYGGPCPPSGIHRYFFTAYALDTALGLPPGAPKGDVLGALDGHVLAEATLMGRYGR